jgi:hypothetical protein
MLPDYIDIKEVEICGEAIKSVIKGFPDYLSDIALNTLYKYNIEEPEQGRWYNFKNYLKALDEIGSTFGNDTLYAIGKQSISCAKIPGSIKSLKAAIDILEDTFALNHRNGKICWVTLIKYDLNGKQVELLIENPYPYHVNRGILTSMAREYNPIPKKIPEVFIDEGSSVLSKGKYIIIW